MPVPTAEPTATAGAGFPAQLTARQLRALLLTPQDLDAQGDVSVVTGGVPRPLTVQQYAAAYTAPTDPAACRSAEGLLAFQSTDSPTSVDWTRTSIQRSTDLRLRSSTLRGDQQVRQFSSAEAAQQFLRDERDWFMTCSTVQYDWGGGRSVTYQGQVDQDLAPDALLTSGTDSDSGAVSSTEFDGWVRDGSVVYAAYLLGDRATSPADLRAAGRALILAGLKRLQAAD